MKTIGVDIGTTTLSFIVMETDTHRVLSSRTISNGSFIKASNDWERIQDPKVIIRKTMDVLDDIIGNYPDFGAIGLTGQMHGILYLDKYGHFLSPLYTWEDGSGNQPEFEGRSIVDLVRDQTGIQAASGYGLITHLYHLNKGFVPRQAVSFCTIMDYLGMKLTDRTTPLMHASNAASLGFFDARTKTYRRDVLKTLGMDIEMLPEVTDRFEILGTFRGIPVITAIGDNQASFLGAVGLKENTALINMGTGGQISVLSNVFFEAPGIEARPIIGDRYLLAGSTLCGGKAYAILERFFRIYAAAAGAPKGSQYSVMEKLLQQEPVQRPLEVETTFKGTRVDPDKTGSIIGIIEENFTPSHLIHGVMSGMAQELYDMYEIIARGTGFRADSIVASGNGLRKNPALQEVFSQMFHAPVTLSPYQEEAACGASMCMELSAEYDHK